MSFEKGLWIITLHNFNHSPHVRATTCNDKNLCSNKGVDGIICSIVGDKDGSNQCVALGPLGPSIILAIHNANIDRLVGCQNTPSPF